MERERCVSPERAAASQHRHAAGDRHRKDPPVLSTASATAPPAPTTPLAAARRSCNTPALVTLTAPRWGQGAQAQVGAAQPCSAALLPPPVERMAPPPLACRAGPARARWSWAGRASPASVGDPAERAAPPARSTRMRADRAVSASTWSVWSRAAARSCRRAPRARRAPATTQRASVAGPRVRASSAPNGASSGRARSSRARGEDAAGKGAAPAHPASERCQGSGG